MAADLVHAQDRRLIVFAAGSLREAIGAVAEDFGAAHKIQIQTEFGPSGRMTVVEANDPRCLIATAAQTCESRWQRSLSI
jgi:ABC-type molybdate transport system substrate-binding protein